MDSSEGKRTDLDKDRRTFLKATVVASAALAVGGIAALSKTITTPGEAQASSTTAVTFPRVQVKDITSGLLATVNNLVTNASLNFYYPLDNEANIMVKLGVAVPNGVGPDGDIIAYSDICQHLGCNPGFVAAGKSPPCNPAYSAKGPEMYCCCHGSIYDMADNAKVIGGPAPYPVPRVILEVDSSGNIFATGMTGPTIYQHGPAGSDDVTYDLQGGTPV
ncbi:MAG: Rieske 2Fe-2S domain-containing protein [Thaumarchaeota archaeon]|nr:Rieske 2Fe-2S domain-containing protein [Nitrososphaerota archaeon]